MLSPQTQGGSDLTHTEGALRTTECGKQGDKDGWSVEGIPPHVHSPEKGAYLRGSKGSTGPA